MNPKTPIWLGMLIGSAIGGYIPGLWGEGLFSISSVLLTALGGIAGIWIGFKLSE